MSQIHNSIKLIYNCREDWCISRDIFVSTIYVETIYLQLGTDCDKMQSQRKETVMNNINHIDPKRVTPDDFIAYIEIEMGGNNKYELDKETGYLIMDRVLYTSTHYPASYGFIPRTYALDDDPLDVFVFCSHKIVPGSIVRCFPVGCITMLDNGKEDHKIIAVPFSDPQWNGYKDVNDFPPHIIDELMHFLQVYKELEPNKKTIIDKIYAADYAKEKISECIERYKKIK